MTNTANPSPVADLASLSLADFTPRLNESFLLNHAEGNLELALIEARDLGWNRPGDRQAFSLVFLGPASPLLPQRMYTLTHKALAVEGIFLVPLGPGAGGMRYEAIFT